MCKHNDITNMYTYKLLKICIGLHNNIRLDGELSQAWRRFFKNNGELTHPGGRWLRQAVGELSFYPWKALLKHVRLTGLGIAVCLKMWYYI